MKKMSWSFRRKLQPTFGGADRQKSARKLQPTFGGADRQKSVSFCAHPYHLKSKAVAYFTWGRRGGVCIHCYNSFRGLRALTSMGVKLIRRRRSFRWARKLQPTFGGADRQKSAWSSSR